TSVYPNPAQTRAESVLTVSETQPVRVELYDMLGRRLRVLYDGSVSEGALHTITVDGAGLASGIYLLRATGRSFSVTRTVTFVR
ncbi:MAG: T9SS type A sorting domain-containing protein, partial [Rhodothermales bacterium]